MPIEFGIGGLAMQLHLTVALTTLVLPIAVAGFTAGYGHSE